jgi:NAD(P)-dependent dehydrogenase (short-subunit alcohol dehydrogenase family)
MATTLTGSTAPVTGATAGIGRAIAPTAKQRLVCRLGMTPTEPREQA